MNEDESPKQKIATKIEENYVCNAETTTDVGSLNTESAEKSVNDSETIEYSDSQKIDADENKVDFQDSTNLGLDFSDNTISELAQSFIDNINPELIIFSESDKKKVMEKLKVAM